MFEPRRVDARKVVKRRVWLEEAVGVGPQMELVEATKAMSGGHDGVFLLLAREAAQLQRLRSMEGDSPPPGTLGMLGRHIPQPLACAADGVALEDALHVVAAHVEVRDRAQSPESYGSDVVRLRCLFLGA